MKLTSLSLTNFRAFKETQTIDFAGLTFLFGANSVGKSSVLMSIAYIYEILVNKNCNPSRLHVMGGKPILGFKDLVYNNDLDLKVKLKIEYDKQEDIGKSYTNEATKDFLDEMLKDLTDYQNDLRHLVFYPSPTYSIRKVAIELEIAWSKELKNAFVTEYKVWINNTYLGQVSFDIDTNNSVLSELNYFHPIFIEDAYEHAESMAELVSLSQPVHPFVYQSVSDMYRLGWWTSPIGPLTKEEEKLIAEHNPFDAFHEISQYHDIKFKFDDKFGWVNRLHMDINAPSGVESLNLNDVSIINVDGNKCIHKSIVINTELGAIPELGNVLNADIEEVEQCLINTINIKLALSDLFVASLDNLQQIMLENKFIGPLRTIPGRHVELNTSPDINNWYDGSASWELFNSLNTDKIKEMDYVVSEARLDLGCRLAVKTIEKRIDYKTFSDDIVLKNLHSEFYTKPIFVDNKSNREVFVDTLGVGVSQLFPLVVASVLNKKGVVAIEQPELHIHPKVQVNIGDVLADYMKEGNFLIETHSEHLILRVLRRVRETFQNNLPQEYTPIRPDDISVIFMESSKNGTKVKRISVTEDGDFEEDWPGGFFEERDEELF